MRKLLYAAMTAVALVGCSAMTGGDANRRSPAEVVDDAAIGTRIKAALAADPDLSALKINVDSRQGAVKLSGEVKSMVLRRKAEDLARRVDGVKSVNNQLVITG